MKIRNIILFLALFLIKLTVNAQVFNVSGTVIDSITKEKLAFVNIIVNEDRTYGTTTDIDGNFTLDISGDAVVQEISIEAMADVCDVDKVYWRWFFLD